MATQADYTAAANAILAILQVDIKQNVPDFMGYQQQALNAAPALAGQCAKAAVDAVDAERANATSQSSS